MEDISDVREFLKQKPKALKKARANEADYRKAVNYFQRLDEAGYNIEQLSKIDDDDLLDKYCQTELSVDDLDLTCLQLAQIVSAKKEKITEELKNVKEVGVYNIEDPESIWIREDKSENVKKTIKGLEVSKEIQDPVATGILLQATSYWNRIKNFGFENMKDMSKITT